VVRRLAPFAALAVIAAACGGKIVSPTPQTVIGTLPATTVPKGNAAAGKAVFLTSGCGACHTFTPAGATAKIGPDLNMLADYAQKAGQPLAEFAQSAIVSPPPPYVPPGFKNIMPTTFGTSLSAKQLADLVAFVTQGH
jgi:cytochrome c551/c552